MQQTESFHSQSHNKTVDADFSGTAVFLILWKKKLLLSLISVLAAAVSAVVVFQMDLWYEATVNFVPPLTQTTSMTGSSGIGSALKDIGLSKLSGKSDSYTFMTILESRTFRDSIVRRFNLAEEYGIPDTMLMQLRKELSANMEIELTSEGNYKISILSKSPKKAAEMANASLSIANSISLRLQQQEASVNRQYLEQRVESTNSAVNAIADTLGKLSSSTLLFSPTDQAGAVAKALAELKSEVMKNDIQYNLLQNTLGENDPAVLTQKNMLAQLQNKLFEAENSSGFAGDFSLRNAAGLGIQYARLMAEMEALMKVKGFLMSMLEQARLDEFKTTPLMYVLDEAVPANNKSKPLRGLIIVGSVLGVFIIACLGIILQDRIASLVSDTHQYKKTS